ncbi:hypothetical protein BIU97_10430 [Curtobacterium sp. MCBA15_009]|uniref:hypothetical protein n=1 Tax=Curtobacterium sp. MCBA15_009 TaxID=1898737 RepID=UPI0008DD331D|nr:hypothetical protein [Curtobacterium sp. MCBA15_009]OII10535.1 hypothetical protein BIU97_10430 [Curtobacterium sp. MCBA15_009]
MTGPEKIARRVFDLQTQIDKLGRASQLGNTTIAGGAAVPITEVVAESVVTNDALPDVQEDIADNDESVSDLTAIFDSFDADMDARFEEARAELDDARSQIEDSMSDIDDTFSTQYDGLSEDVDTAIRAAGSALTEAEAASNAALAAAGLAASKGETIVQVSAPSGSRANPANLWIDISLDSSGVPKNQPNRYNPETAKWEPITDAQTVAAAQAAATATAAAQAAKDAAAQASAAAGVAQQTASDANQAALTAAGIANGKGKVIYQASKPTGANAAVGNLWIRSSDNTPWAFDTAKSDWVQVTDKAATDAAAAAAAANQAAVAASNAAKAAQDTADGKPLILFSSTAGPSGTAPTGTIWFLWDAAKNVAGQWLQSGTLASPEWTPQQIRSEVIANLDVAKLTVGSAAIAELVAQKIAAATANFQTVNVSNLFVTTGATMAQATIDFLFANVVQAKKITAGMIDVATLSGVTITGARIKSAASGQRVEMAGTQLDFYDPQGAYASSVRGWVVNARGRGVEILAPAATGFGATGRLTVSTQRDIAVAFADQSVQVDVSADAGVDGPNIVGRQFWVKWADPNGRDSVNRVFGSGDDGVTELVVARARIGALTATQGASVLGSGSFTASVIAGGTVTAAGFRLADGSDPLADTGWIPLTAASGLTGTNFAYRIKQGRVEFTGQIKINSGSFPNGYTTLVTMPAGARPQNYLRTPIGMFNGYVALLIVNTNGAVQLGASGDRTADTVYLGGSGYPADR